MTTKATVNKEEMTTVGTAAEKALVEVPVVETAEKTVEAPETVTEKATAKKTTRKTAAKKTAAKTTTRKTTARKTTAKKTAPEMNKEVHIQFAGNDILAKDLVSKAAAVWTEEMGKKAEDIKDIKVYANVDEGAAYYVINEDVRGSFPL
ncbi:MAG: DUF6465 family protein [Lachnospiraceae bacterium]|nr:DUF6465 family protein [Lachnospiraceae bacterium]MDD6618267.1 DUF6465 family protein [Clostridiales bacterium]MDY4769656.1 DUF6465 family protein [Lachnospiraceae bacterium]